MVAFQSLRRLSNATESIWRCGSCPGHDTGGWLCDGYAHAHACTDIYCRTTNADSVSDQFALSHLYPLSDGDSFAYQYTYAHCYGDRDCQSDADAHTDPTASCHTACSATTGRRLG